MAWMCANYNIRLRAVHVCGVLNTMPDTISRLHENGKLAKLYTLLANWMHGRFFFPKLCDHMSVEAIKFMLFRFGARTQ